MPQVPINAFLSLKDRTVMCWCESGEGGDPPAWVHRLQLILALILPLQVINPQANLQEDKAGSY